MAQTNIQKLHRLPKREGRSKPAKGTIVVRCLKGGPAVFGVIECRLMGEIVSIVDENDRHLQAICPLMKVLRGGRAGPSSLLD